MGGIIGAITCTSRSDLWDVYNIGVVTLTIGTPATRKLGDRVGNMFGSGGNIDSNLYYFKTATRNII